MKSDRYFDSLDKDWQIYSRDSGTFKWAMDNMDTSSESIKKTLDNIDIKEIEKYIRRKKLEQINKNNKQ